MPHHWFPLAELNLIFKCKQHTIHDLRRPEKYNYTKQTVLQTKSCCLKIRWFLILFGTNKCTCTEVKINKVVCHWQMTAQKRSLNMTTKLHLILQKPTLNCLAILEEVWNGWHNVRWRPHLYLPDTIRVRLCFFYFSVLSLHLAHSNFFLEIISSADESYMRTPSVCTSRTI